MDKVKSVKICSKNRNFFQLSEFAIGNILSDTKTSCFAWALIPNHFHLLLRSGSQPLATVMRRLLTGHAMGFNRRHHRSGQLFQNRYKSILCQEEPYLLELIRYIHLNPLRAGEARRRYQAYVLEGIEMGKRPDLTGGGLVRSSGGWSVIKEARKAHIHSKSDERILGDSDFVDEVLKAADESLQRRYALKAKGWDLDRLARKSARIYGLEPEQLYTPGKQPARVKARSVFCYWATAELGVTMTQLAGLLKISQPAVSICARRGERIVLAEGFRMMDG